MQTNEELFMNHAVSFSDLDATWMIHEDLFRCETPKRSYPVIISIYREEPARSVPLHRHPGMELIYSRNRMSTVTIDGKQVLLQPGDFVLVSSYALHSIVPSPGDKRQDVMSISFQENYLRQMCPYFWDYEVNKDAPGATEEAKKRMVRLCECLRNQVEDSEKDKERYFQNNQLLFAMMQLIYHDFLIGKKKNEGRQYEIRNKMETVLDYLQEHYRENLTTQSVADHFWYTREYFCRLFKRYANETFKSYLTGLRLIAVVQRMRVSGQSAGQIALEEGFPDEKSFFAAFKKKYGMTPGRWREMIVSDTGLQIADGYKNEEG